MLSEWNAEVNAFHPRPKDRQRQRLESGYSDTKSTQHPTLKASNAQEGETTDRGPSPFTFYNLLRLSFAPSLSRLNEVLAFATNISALRARRCRSCLQFHGIGFSALKTGHPVRGNEGSCTRCFARGASPAPSREISERYRAANASLPDGEHRYQERG